MSIQIRAIYENGVFRPLQSVCLSERQEVTVTCDGESGDHALFALSPERWQTFSDALDEAPRHIPALRKLLTETSVFDGPVTRTA